MLFKDVPLRTKRALSINKVYGVSALVVPNGGSVNSVNALLALCFFIIDQQYYFFYCIAHFNMFVFMCTSEKSAK